MLSFVTHQMPQAPRAVKLMCPQGPGFSWSGQNHGLVTNGKGNQYVAGAIMLQ